MGILEDKGRARVFYRYLSTVYDRVNPLFWTEEMRDAALETLDVSPGDEVLDVGCGTGFATAALRERADAVHALDQSDHQLAKAREKFPRHGAGDEDAGRVQFYRGDAERLPFAADSFDVVWSSGSIEYWPNPVDALAECRRVTRSGGQVLIVGPLAPRLSVARKLADAIMLFYDEDEADRMFAAAGFDDVEHTIQQAHPGSPRAITTVARVE